MPTLSETSLAFLRLARRLRPLAAQWDSFAEAFRSNGPARYPGVTVYRVKKHRVAAHWRAEHVAVRVVNPNAFRQ